MNFLGVLNFSATYLPFVLTIFSYAISGTIPYSDVLGITFGHLIWFMEDVAPVYLGSSSIMRLLTLAHFSGHKENFNVPQ
jgi:Derlin-2/3